MSQSLSRFAAPILWGTSQAGSTLLFASSAWMVSGLTSSPFLNGLFPAVGALPALVNLGFRRSGYWLQLLGVSLLLICSFFYGQSQIAKIALIIASFLAIFMHGIGQEVSIVPLQKSIMASSGVSMRRLQIGQEIGVLLGNLMTAMLFPAVRQFMPALALMFPMAHFLHRSSQASGVQESSAPVKKKSESNSLCLMQGVVLGSLFGMLALWVREIDGGKCFDFAMVLVSYSVGRSLVAFVPKMHASLRYILIVLLLVLIELIPIPVISILMFSMVGALVGASDFSLVERLESFGDLPSRWQVLQNSSAIGGLVGSFMLGIICEALGLNVALFAVCFGFVALAFVVSRKSLMA